MTTERAVLAGGCFWGMQDLIRKMAGVVSTRVGYSGGDVPNATYRNHGTHAEAIEIVFDPTVMSYRRLLEFFFQCRPTTVIGRATTAGCHIARRSTSLRKPSGLKRSTRSRMSRPPVYGRAKWSLKLRRWGPSGRLNRNTRTTWSGTQGATPATSRGPTGSCLGVPQPDCSRRPRGTDGYRRPPRSAIHRECGLPRGALDA